MNRKQRRLQNKKKTAKTKKRSPMTFEQAQLNMLLEKGVDTGLDLIEVGKLDEAEALFNEMVKRAPNIAVLHYNLGTIEIKRRNSEKAMNHFRNGIAADPKDYNCISGLGFQMIENGEAEAGLKLCKKAVKIKENKHTLGIYSLGLNRLGRFDESLGVLKRTLEIDPYNSQALNGIAQTNKLKADDPVLDEMHHAFENRYDIYKDDEQSARIGFTLGKVYHDLKKYDEAFEYYKQGNEDRGKAFAMKGDIVTASSKQVKKLFTNDIYEKFKGQGYRSEKPIFLVGMPRSGTTLTEQIISSHPDVYGAGELRVMQNAIIDPDNYADIAARAKRDMDIDQELIDNLSEDRLKKIGKAYVNYLDKIAPKAARVTDKMPFNFYRVGMIKLALPDAKIIFCRRNPMDIGLSIYRQNFMEDFSWAYDLKRIGNTLKSFDDLMGYWLDMLGDDILISDYESLVSNPEEESRRLIDYCDLEWDDACLSPHKQNRNVNTASFAQVRAPINTKSVEGWRKYESGLKPLADILGVK